MFLFSVDMLLPCKKKKKTLLGGVFRLMKAKMVELANLYFEFLFCICLVGTDILETSYPSAVLP